MNTTATQRAGLSSGAGHFAPTVVWRLAGVAALLVFALLPARAADDAVYRELRPNAFLKRWLVLAPLPVPAAAAKPADEATLKQAFADDLLAGCGGETGVQPANGALSNVRGRSCAWRLVDSASDTIDLRQPDTTSRSAVAYAAADIDLPAAQTLWLGFGSDDAIKVWLNGRLVHENWVMRGVHPDDDLVRLEFAAGKNRLLLKILNAEGSWGFACRPVEAQGGTDRFLRAVAQGDLEAVKTALDRGADVNARHHGVSAWQTACIAGDQELADFLVARGADAKAPFPAPETVIDAQLSEAVRGDSPGVAVLVARDGKVLFEKGWGYANVENAVPFTPQTKSRIGSVTKQFTAAAILRLQEQGKLSVHDKLSTFIPDFPRGDEVTLHHLLTHTSGIHSYTSKPDFPGTVTIGIKPDELIQSFKKDPYDFAPGEKHLYNNGSFFLLGYIVAKVSGRTYGEFLRQEFFVPLGMSNTGVHTPTAILTHEATGYSLARRELTKAVNWDMSRAGGAGALYSTAEDLFRWNEAVFGGKVLSPASLTAAFTPVVTRQDTEKAKDTGYGYGWAIGRTRGLRVISHGGGLPGFLTYLLRYPEQHVTVAVLTNASESPAAGPPSAIASRVAQLYLWREMKPRETIKAVPIDPSALGALVGRYDYGGAILCVTRVGDRLFAQLTGQARFEIFPKSASTFFWRNAEAEIQFVRNSRGEVVEGIHRQNGTTIHAPRMAEPTSSPARPWVCNVLLRDVAASVFVLVVITLSVLLAFVLVRGLARQLRRWVRRSSAGP